MLGQNSDLTRIGRIARSVILLPKLYASRTRWQHYGLQRVSLQLQTTSACIFLVAIAHIAIDHMHSLARCNFQKNAEVGLV